MTCIYCGKTRCIHLDPEDDQYVPAVEAQLAQATTVAVEKPKAGEPLFELCDLRSMRCRLCQYTVPPGPYQAILRVRHGRMHVRQQQAVETRKGLPEGAIHFRVK